MDQHGKNRRVELADVGRRHRRFEREAARVARIRDALTHRDPIQRRHGCAAATALGHRSLLDDLLERLDDDDAKVEAAAAHALRNWRSRDDLLDWLRAATGPNETPVYRRRAIDGLARLRDSRTLKLLVELLDDPDLSRDARRALVRLTAHDSGPGSRDWEDFIRRYGRGPRAWWLANALVSDVPLLRRCAVLELPAVLGVESLGCHPDAPSAERARARRFILEQLGIAHDPAA